MLARTTWLVGDAASLFRSVAVGTLAVILASPVAAQQIDGLSAGARRQPAAAVSNERSRSANAVGPESALDTSSVGSMAAPLGGRRSAPAAGVLSFLIPGAGSFYAGNNVHGAIHLGIEIGAYLLVVSQTKSCLNSIGTGTIDCKSNVGFVGAGALVIIGNDIWSIFTAVHDANSHNAAVGGA